jgi:thiol:disulfide interchange protein
MRRPEAPEPTQPPEGPAPPIHWRADERVALADAKAQQRPALVFFHADWSAASRAAKRELRSRSELQRAARGIIAVEVDLSEISEGHEARAARFAVDRMPTVLIFDARGRERARFEGPMRIEDLVEALEER